MRPFFVLRIKENRREANALWMAGIQHDLRGHRAFMQEFTEGRYLAWVKVPVEGNHGPGPDYSWCTYTSLPDLTRYTSKRAALDAWEEQPVGDIVVEVVRVSIALKVV
jgi:hypothetical protein